VVVGTVEVADWTGWPPWLTGRYDELYRRRVTAGLHDHVHGANLGLSARRTG
jgi:hypothetical protein